MKKLFFLAALLVCVASYGQKTIWNHTRFTLGDLKNSRWIADMSPTQTNYVLFQDIEVQFVNDSVFTSRAAINKLRDSSFSVIYTKVQSDANYLPISGGVLSSSPSGYIGLPTLTTSPPTLTNVTTIFRDSLGSIAWKNSLGFVRSFRAIALTAPRTYFTPDSDGTIALKPYTVQYGDTANMLAPYQRLGQGVVFFYDSTQFRGLGTGLSPFRLTNTITAGTCTNCNITFDSTGRIFAASNAPGGVGTFLFLPTQSTVVGPPGAAGRRVYDSAGINYITQAGIITNFTYNASVNRKYTWPDLSLTVAGIDVNNNFTAVQTLTSATTPQITIINNGANQGTISVGATGIMTLGQSSGNGMVLPNIGTSNITLASNAVLTLAGTGRFAIPATMTAAGTTGAQTINKISGSVNFAAGATSIIVTNSTVQTASSEIFLQVYGTDATANIARITNVATGTFTITIPSATAETKVGFIVYNGFGWIFFIILLSIFFAGFKKNCYGKQMSYKTR